MLVCDKCVRKCCHIYCLNPPLEFIPENEWLCDFCVNKGFSSPNPTAGIFNMKEDTILKNKIKKCKNLN